VVEEFSQYDSSFNNGQDPGIIPHDEKFWGPSYFFSNLADYKNAPESSNKACEKDGKIINFFLYEALKNCRYAVPFLKNIEYLMPKESAKDKKSRISNRASTKGKSAKIKQDDKPDIDMIEKPFDKTEHPFACDIEDDQVKLAKVEEFILRDK
jgi:hypothetical protein